MMACDGRAVSAQRPDRGNGAPQLSSRVVGQLKLRRFEVTVGYDAALLFLNLNGGVCPRFG